MFPSTEDKKHDVVLKKRWEQNKKSVLKTIIPTLLVSFFFLFGVSTSQAGQVTVTWDGGGGDTKWDTAANWDNDTVPNNGGGTTYKVIVGANIYIPPSTSITIDELDIASGYEVELHPAATLTGAILSGEGTLESWWGYMQNVTNSSTSIIALAPGGSYAALQLNPGTFTNNGVVKLSAAAGNDIGLFFAGNDDITYSGTGVFNLTSTDISNNRIASDGNPNTRLVIDTGQTFKIDGLTTGKGRFENNLKVLNNGTIDINQVADFHLALPSAGWTNNGTIQIRGGSQVGFYDGASNPILTGGTLSVQDTSKLWISDGDLTLKNVTLTGSGDDAFVSTGGYLENATNNSTIAIKSSYWGASELTIKSAITNNGTINLGISGQPTNGGLWINANGGDVIYSGTTGVINFTSTDYTHNRIKGDTASTRLIIDAGQTLNFTATGNDTGGTFGDDQLKIWNKGTISATGVKQYLYINPSNVENGFVNDGTFEALGGTYAQFISNGNTNNLVNSGTMKVSGTGSVIRFDSVGMSGTGNWLVQDNGLLALYGSGDGVSGTNLTIDSTGKIGGYSTLTLQGDFSFASTAEANMIWGSSSKLKMTGGTGVNDTDYGNYVALEVGGVDNGSGDLAGYLAGAGSDNTNFDLTELVIGSGAHVKLVDALNNGNRTGSTSTNEALYVDTLTFLDGTGKLFTNGLNIYYNNITGNASQITVYNTEAGRNIVVDTSDSVILTYDNVSVAGNTTRTAVLGAGTVGGESEATIFSDFTNDQMVGAMLEPAVYYFDTTAAFIGDGVLIKIPYTDNDFNTYIGSTTGLTEDHLRLFHRLDNGTIEDITATAEQMTAFGLDGTPYLNTSTNIIYGVTTSFSSGGPGVNPEPATIIMILMGLGGFFYRKFKQ